MSLYSKKLLQHFLNPKNIGKIKNPDAVGKATNPICGDEMKVYLKIGKNRKGEEFIKDIKVETYGCAAAIATSSMATELIKGKTLKEAQKLTGKAIEKALGGLPPAKVHCSLLADVAIKKAIEKYLKKKKGS